MADAVLSINAGSSSLKFALFEIGAARRLGRAAVGQIEGIGTQPHLIVRDGQGEVLAEHRWPSGEAITHEAYFAELFDLVEGHLGRDSLVGIGHRIVHGGERFTRPVVVSDQVLDQLEALTPLAPLHQPHNLAAVRAARAMRPGTPAVACFDTAFHRTLPAPAVRFALPRDIERQGVRRYGFHGLSYEYIAKRLSELDPEAARGRVIAAHLGNGASLCAMRAGASIDTTMGFTALDGLVMGTRSGALDPGVLLYLIQQRGFSGGELQDLLYKQSGLLGLSGISSDMRTLLARAEPSAKAAVELFVYRLAREAAALASSLGGLDCFIFTAGIGENAPKIRAMAAARLRWLGVEIDPEANTAGAAVISTPASSVAVRVIPTDEERMVALHTLDLI